MNVRIIFMLVCSLFLGSVENVSAHTFSQSEHRQFLEQMGFRNYPEIIRQNLNSEEGKALPRLNQEVLRTNARRYAMIHRAGELASAILAKALPRLSEQPARVDRLVELIARFLALQPVAVPEYYPDIFSGMANNAQYEREKVVYLAQAVAEAMTQQQEQMLSDTIATLYTVDELNSPDAQADIKYFREQLSTYGDEINFDPDMGQTRFLGQALALGFVRYAILSGQPDLRSKLNDAAYAYGQILDNFISSNLTLVNRDGKAQTIKIYDGDFVMENSGPSSAGTPAALKAGTWWGWWNSKSQDLNGSLLLAAIVGDAGGLEVKVRNGESLSVWENVRYYLSQREAMIKGNTHGGAAHVYKDSETGLERIEILDNYPHGWLTREESRGGIRIIGPEQFGGDGLYMVFTSVHYDPRKFLAQIQSQFADGGEFHKPWWTSDIYEVDDKGDLVKIPGQYHWTSQASEEFRQQILKADLDDADTIIAKLSAGAMNRMLEYATKTGLAFGGAGEINARGMGYCTFTVAAAWQETWRVDIQTAPDQWRIPVATAARFNLVPGVDIHQRIYAPNGPAFDPMQDRHDRVVYPYRAPFQRAQLRSGIRDQDLEPKVTEALFAAFQPMRQRSDDSTKKFEGWMRELVELNGLRRDSGVGGSDVQAVQLGPRRVVGRGMKSGETAPEIVVRPAAAAIVSPSARRNLDREQKVGNPYQMLLDYRRAVSPEIVTAHANLKIFSARIAELVTRQELSIEQKQLVAEVMARLMTLRRLPPPNTFPHRLRLIVDPGARERAIEQYLAEVVGDQIETHTRKIISDVVFMIYGSDLNHFEAEATIRDLYLLLGPVVQRMYLDPEQMPGHRIGANVAAMILRHQDIGADLDRRLLLRGVSAGRSAFFNVLGTDVRLVQAPDLSGLPNADEGVNYAVYSDIVPDLTAQVGSLIGAPRFNNQAPTASEAKRLRISMIDNYLAPLYKRNGVHRLSLIGSELSDALQPPKPDCCQFLHPVDLLPWWPY